MGIRKIAQIAKIGMFWDGGACGSEKGACCDENDPRMTIFG